jgi:2-polyprenyl-3-methyl-5-hydroxy-6-metoxy-1,4-benzoquinol methylase
MMLKQGAEEEVATSAKEIYDGYMFKNDDPGYYKVTRHNQDSYEDNFGPLLPPDKNAGILEIGCGAGQLLYYIRSKGYRSLVGVDLGEEQVGYLTRMGIEGHVISSISGFLEKRHGSYDLIIMNQVMEHLRKDTMLRDLRSIHAALRPGGALVFMTPNMACLSGTFQRYIDLTHEIGFTERSAFQALSVAGFKDIAIRGERVRFSLNPKRAAWCLSGIIWRAVLGLIYTIERGSDRPRVLHRNLIAVGKK